MRENAFQAKLITELHRLFPDAIVLKNDPNYLQGFPDILVLNGRHWAALEVKRKTSSKRQANQPYYISLCQKMSYGAFVSPENLERILDELQHAL